MSSVIATIIYFTVCIAVILYGMFFLRKQTRLKKNGILTKGFIYERRPRFIRVRFITKQEKWITGKSYLKGIYEEGDTIPIYYNPDNPLDFIIDNRQSKLRIYGLIILGGLILLYGIATIYFTQHLLPFHT